MVSENVLEFFNFWFFIHRCSTVCYSLRLVVLYWFYFHQRSRALFWNADINKWVPDNSMQNFELKSRIKNEKVTIRAGSSDSAYKEQGTPFRWEGSDVATC